MLVMTSRHEKKPKKQEMLRKMLRVHQTVVLLQIMHSSLLKKQNKQQIKHSKQQIKRKIKQHKLVLLQIKQQPMQHKILLTKRKMLQIKRSKLLRRLSRLHKPVITKVHMIML